MGSVMAFHVMHEIHHGGDKERLDLRHLLATIYPEAPWTTLGPVTATANLSVPYAPDGTVTFSFSPSAQHRGPATTKSSGNDTFEGRSHHPIADPSVLTRPTGVMRDGSLTDSNRSRYLTPRRRGHNPIYRAPEASLTSLTGSNSQNTDATPESDGSDWGEPPEYTSDPSESFNVVSEENIWVCGPTGGCQVAVDLEVLDAQLDETLAETVGMSSVVSVKTIICTGRGRASEPHSSAQSQGGRIDPDMREPTRYWVVLARSPIYVMAGKLQT
ncbi:hypothetical protein N7461_004707 [Penicillium sp. DV-2018c]|nr:hypothetical protein N7461_004707 [Penicillium sp. DV-2018c]